MRTTLMAGIGTSWDLSWTSTTNPFGVFVIKSGTMLRRRSSLLRFVWNALTNGILQRDIATHTNFHVLHDLARHLTHLEETLEVALTTLESMEAAQDVLRCEISRVRVKTPQFREEFESLLRENALDMYHSRGAIKASAARAKSLSARHKNEINLVGLPKFGKLDC